MAREKLCALFDDPEKDVRGAAASSFGSEDAFETGAARSLARRFVASAALDDNMDDLLTGLEHYAGTLKDYAGAVFTMADRLAGPLAAEARDHQTQRPFDADLLAKVLLRLYEQAEGTVKKSTETRLRRWLSRNVRHICGTRPLLRAGTALCQRA
jgi:hypothetical protein